MFQLDRQREIYYSYKQKVYTFFLYLDNTDDFRLILKTIWILNDYENNNILQNKKNHINMKCSLLIKH